MAYLEPGQHRIRSAEAAIPVARRLGTPDLNLHGTGLDGRGRPIQPVEEVTGSMWLAAEETLRRVAALGQREGVVFTIENLNTEVDHPGTRTAPSPLTDSARPSLPRIAQNLGADSLYPRTAHQRRGRTHHHVRRTCSAGYWLHPVRYSVPSR